MQKIITSVALATVAVAALAGSAHADLNISGAVGLPINPTAQIPGAEGARIQANYFDLGGNAEYYGLFAAKRVGEKIEINGGINKLSANAPNFPGSASIDRTGFSIGAKYLISRENDAAGVRLAVGAGYNRALLKNTNAYLVGTKYLGALDGGRVPITAHLGLRYDNFDGVPDAFGGSSSSDKFSVFVGAEVPISQTGNFTAVGELGTKIADNGNTPYSISVRYRPQGRPFGASVGLAQTGIGDGSRLFAQLGYTFNTR